MYAFETLMNMCAVSKHGASAADVDYLAGYQRGLRRAHHGDRFGTDAEHETWLGCGNHHPDRAAGYRDGLKMIPPRTLNLNEGNDHA